jgi:hypothetical protein
MIDVAKDIHALKAFKRQTKKFARLLRKSRRSMVLTVKGKARFVIFDAEAFEAWKDQVESLQSVNEALAEKGEGRPAAKVHAELRKKYFGLRRPVSQAR